MFEHAKGGVLRHGLHSKPWICVPCGHTVLTGAVQIGWALGYRSIYVVGCDLDYSGPRQYAYAENRRPHDAKFLDPDRVNTEFALLRRDIEQAGGSLVNASDGGFLETLPREDFGRLFNPAR